MIYRFSLVFLLAVLAGGAGYAQPANADAPDVNRRVTALTHSIMSPFCPGLSLAACPSSGAADLRDELERRLGDGESEAALMSDLIRRFGPGVTGIPEKRGLGLLAWIGPPMIAVGLGVLIRFTLGRHQERTASETIAVGPTLSDRIDDELDRLSL